MNAPSVRQFQVERPSFARHYNVNWPNGQPAFYCDISKFTPNKPSLTLHAGADDSAPPVAASFLSGFGSSGVRLGLGNPSDPRGVQWENMSHGAFSHSQYDFQMNVPPTQWEPAGRRGYSWQSGSRLSGRGNFSLIDGATGSVVASYSKAHSFGRGGGELQIFDQRGPEFDFMVVISFLSILEESTRRKKRGVATNAAIL